MTWRRSTCRTAPAGVITFGLKGGRNAAVRMMDSLKLIAIVTHVADARSCVLHPASHTHRQMNDQELIEAGVQRDLIRFSVESRILTILSLIWSRHERSIKYHKHLHTKRKYGGVFMGNEADKQEQIKETEVWT